MLINYDNTPGFTISDFVTDTNATARASLRWLLANYLLLRYAHTYVAWENPGSTGYLLANQHEYATAAAIGTATDDYHLAQGVFVRDFTNGFAIVNPDPGKSYAVAVGSGYKDLYGNALKSITMKPDSGAVLLMR